MSMKIRFAPSPQWFSTRAFDTNFQGHLAYGSRNSVFVYDIGNELFFKNLFLAHDNKVTSVSYCKIKGSLLLCTGCESGVCKVWNLEDKPKAIHTCQPEQKQSAVTEWKFGADDRIFVGWGKRLKEWNLSSKTIILCKCNFKDDIVILSSSAAAPELLAVGLRGGKIDLVNVLNTNTYRRLYGHSNEICYLSWHPTLPGKIVSAASDGDVRSWTVSSVDKKEDKCNVYHMRSHRKMDPSRMNREWRCAMFHPLKENAIISTGHNGDVVWWEDIGDKSEKKIFKTDMGGHERMLFLVCPVHHDKTKILTSSLDRSIILWDLETHNSLYQLYVLAGSILDSVFSPFDNATLAIGCRDASIRVWNTLTSSKNSVKIYSYGIKGPVQRIAWHPKKECLLAFSSDEGRIGILDTLTNRNPSYFSRCHKGTAYGLSWGPCPALADPEQDASQLYLYSCGKGSIYIHTITSFSRDGVDFKDLVQSSDKDSSDESFSDISWKHDFSLLAVGSDNGIVKIFTGNDFTLVARLMGLKLQIQCLQWHPEYVSLKSTRCQNHGWLACGSNESGFMVFDVETALKNTISDACSSSEVIDVTEPMHHLKNHQEKITQFCWSPHIEGQLASGSCDRTVQIWDVNTGKLIASYLGHEGRVFAVEWSYLDPDVIYSAGEDGLLFNWKISEQTNLLPPKREKRWRQKRAEMMAEKKSIAKSENAPEQDAEEKENGCEGDAECSSSVSKEVNEVLQQAKEHEEVVENLLGYEHNTYSKSANAWKRETRKQKFFRNHALEMASRKRVSLIADSILLAKEVAKDNEQVNGEDSKDASETDEFPCYMGLFRSQEKFYETYEKEKSLELDQNYARSSYYVWNGNVKEALLDAAEKGEITERMLSLAPLVSRPFWLEMCEKYANQCIAHRLFTKSIDYLLMCNKVKEAINVLKDYCHPKDALILARTRLPMDDPQVVELFDIFGQKLASGGCLESAANCYITIKKPLKAAALVAKKCDALGTKLAADICRIFHLEEQAQEYTRNCVRICLLNSQWDVAEEVLSVESSLQALVPLITIHKSLMAELVAEDKGFGLTEELFSEPTTENRTLWKCNKADGVPYLQDLYNSIPWQDFVDKDSNFYENASSEMGTLLLSNEASISEIVYNIAIHIMFFFCDISRGSEKDLIPGQLKHLNEAYASATKAIEGNYFHVLSQLLFPCDVVWDVEFEKVILVAENDGLVNLLAKVVASAAYIVKIPDVLMSLGIVNASFSSDGHAQCFDELIVKTTEVSSLLAFFALSVVHQMELDVLRKKSVVECEESSMKRDLLEGITGQNIAYISDKVGNEEITDALPENGESSSADDVTREDGIEDASIAVEEFDSVRNGEIIIITNDVNDQYGIEDTSIVAISNGEMGFDDSNGLNIKDSDHEQNDSLNSELVNGGAGNLTSALPKQKSTESHQPCLDVCLAFLKLLDLCACLVCRDVFMVGTFINNRKQKIETELFSLKNKTVKVPVGVEQSVEVVCAENSDNNENGQDINSDKQKEIVSIDETVSNDGVDLNRDVIATNGLHSELEEIYNQVSGALEKFNKKVKGMVFPDPKLILKFVAKVCDKKLEERIRCRQVRLVMFALSNQLDIWSSKFDV